MVRQEARVHDSDARYPAKIQAIANEHKHRLGAQQTEAPQANLLARAFYLLARHGFRVFLRVPQRRIAGPPTAGHKRPAARQSLCRAHYRGLPAANVHE